MVNTRSVSTWNSTIVFKRTYFTLIVLPTRLVVDIMTLKVHNETMLSKTNIEKGVLMHIALKNKLKFSCSLEKKG